MFGLIFNDDTVTPSESTIEQFYDEFGVQSLLKRSNFHKRCGFAVSAVLKFLLILVFSGKNLFRLLDSKAAHHLPFARDTVYRFLNSDRYNWRALMMRITRRVIGQLQPLTDQDRREVLIADTTIYDRNRSKSVELLARVYDHTENRVVKGFRMLTLGWSDGATFLPVAVSLLSSKDRNKRLQEASPDVDGRTVGGKRRAEAVRKAPEVLASLIRRASEVGITAPYLLVDSWFSLPATVLDLWRTGVDVITKAKKTEKVFYRFKDNDGTVKTLTLKRLYAHLRKRRGRAKILASAVVHFANHPVETSPPIKLVFVRDPHRRRQWLALLSTDTGLSDEEIIRLYGKRWEIEVFFKMAKSYLKLDSEFQGRCYDAIRAQASIVCIRYMILAVSARRNEDGRTFGRLFYDLFDEVADLTFETALLRLIDIMTEAIRNVLVVTEEQIQELLDLFFASIPAWLRDPLDHARCES